MFLNKQIDYFPSNLSNETKENKNGNRKSPSNLHICKVYLNLSLFVAIFYNLDGFH